MSSSCLKLLLALTLFVIITECRPQGNGEGRPRKARKTRKTCTDDADCGSNFACVQTPKGKKCAKPAAPAVKPSKYKNTDYKEGTEKSHRPDVCW